MKKIYVCEKDYVWNSATCNCENGKYLASIMNDSAMNYLWWSYRIIWWRNKNYSINFNVKKVICNNREFL